MKNDGRCFVVASGSSIKEMDLSVLKGETVICVNTSYRPLMEIGVQPSYLCIADYLVYNTIGKELEKVPIPVVIDTHCVENSSLRIRNVIRVVQRLSNLWDVGTDFVWNLDKGTCAGMTVTINLAIPLGLYLGFDTVYLVGCDTNRSGHFDGTPNKLAGRERIILSYQKIRDSMNNHPFKVINAGIGGELEIFSRVNFKSLF